MFFAATSTLILVFYLNTIHAYIYVYDTEDGVSFEKMSCVYHGIDNIPYCRRLNPNFIVDNSATQTCYNGGRRMNFSTLKVIGIEPDVVLSWSSSIEKADDYAAFLYHSSSSTNLTIEDSFLCDCSVLSEGIFEKFCFFKLMYGATTILDALQEQFSYRHDKWRYHQSWGNILCYSTLSCDSGLLCLEWQNICDRFQNCMDGWDEVNCDMLEFNECSDNEFRCSNGLCIPEAYFLDGTLDCLDGTDEMYSELDFWCATKADDRFFCDEHLCIGTVSCGDGSCANIYHRYPFQTEFVDMSTGCATLRHVIHMCEMWHNSMPLWTLPDGRCSGFNEPILNKENIDKNDIEKYCIFLVKCAMSRGYGYQCPCNHDKYSDTCKMMIQRECPMEEIEYPQGGVIWPFIRTIYFRNRTDWHVDKTPDRLIFIGSIRCRGYQATNPSTHRFYLLYGRNIVNSVLDLMNADLESRLCNSQLAMRNRSVAAPQIHPMCWSTDDLRMKSYAFVDICNNSHRCVSNYRAHDGLADCFDHQDNTFDTQLTAVFCPPYIRKYRLICGYKCLAIIRLGDGISNCYDDFDEFLFGVGQPINTVKCQQRDDKGCQIMREYLATVSSGTWNTPQVPSTSKLQYRFHCDSFWQSVTAYDESKNNCQIWVCLPGQYQCRTGQCIPPDWICDGVWDCSDASDEQGLLILDELSDHNLATLVSGLYDLKTRCRAAYDPIQPFSKYCNSSQEFPCLTTNGSNDPLNFAINRPCISIQKIGDGHADCYGALDERNTFSDCNQKMLGFQFICMNSTSCIPLSNVCIGPCETSSDNGPICMKKFSSRTCINFRDALCLNGTCVPNGRCNKISDCSEGEDEFWCEYDQLTGKDERFYRSRKEDSYKNIVKDLRHLAKFPVIASPVSKHALAITKRALSENQIMLLFFCNLGLIAFHTNLELNQSSLYCFCPPSFFGQKCQFNSDRITIITHLNLTNSNYTSTTNDNLILKIRATFLFNNEQILDRYEFHIRPTHEQAEDKYVKHRFYLVYSRSHQQLMYKRSRYYNRSDIVLHHPYSVQFELFELLPDEDVQVIAHWHFPIYFDFLPAFRLAKVLTFPVISLNNSNCLCGINATCISVLNINKTKCICKTGRYGPSCEYVDSQCSYFCARHAFCQPNDPPYKRPTCICPHDAFGPRCFLQYTACKRNPCQNNSTCFYTYDPSGLKPYKCKCTSIFYGPTCTQQKIAVRLNLKISDNISLILASVVQFYDPDEVTLQLKLQYQQVERTLPLLWYYQHENIMAPMFSILKLYQSDHYANGPVFYLLYLQPNTSVINITTELSSFNQCPPAITLLNISKLSRA